MKYAIGLLKAVIFVLLFGFALNNRQNATLNFLFDYAITLPMIVVVLGSFALGIVLGILVMLPRWWQHRRQAQQVRQQLEALQAQQAAAAAGNAPVAVPATRHPDPDQQRHMTDPSLPITDGQ